MGREMDDARSVASVADDKLQQLQAQLHAEREARKLVEQDAQLLANRIALLQQEEQKAWKKIHQTKERAKEILRLRAENEARQIEKEQAALELQRQQQQISKKQKAEKEQSRKAKMAHMAAVEAERRRVAEEVKAKKIAHKKALQEHKNAVQTKAKKLRKKVAAASERARRKRELEESRKLRQNKAVYNERVAEEDSLRVAKETEVAQLEALEAELIEKLKRTQARQQKAFSQLEEAMQTDRA